MSNVLSQRRNKATGKTLSPGWKPVRLQFAPEHRAIAYFSNGKQAYTSCLRCPSAPCVLLAPNETVPSNFDRFPADRNENTCASLAITISDNGAPTIDFERCIMCGVCASRCPVGAIRIERRRGAVVEDAINDAFVESPSETAATNKVLLERFSALDSSGSLLEESDAILKEVFSRLDRAWGLVGDRYPNMLARNLLIGAGIGAALGRKGNTHMRMDLVLAPPGVIHGVAEVEFGQEAVLDAPRDTLDALAVLVSRYGWTLDTTTALIVTDVLPNRRSEYWHILQDISNVLKVRIGTVTIFALMLCTWNRKVLDLTHGHPFYVDRATSSYRAQVLDALMCRPLHLGADPRPQVDIAK